MEFVVFIVAVIAAFVGWNYVKGVNAEKAERKRQLTVIAYQISDILEKITTLKTTSARVNNCSKALGLLDKAEGYEECRQVITNFDVLRSRLDKIQKVLPVVDYVDKSYKHRFKGKDSSEKNTLLDALFEITTKEITNQDIIEAEVYTESAGEIITVEGIKNRLKGLGWENGDTKPAKDIHKKERKDIKPHHKEKMTGDGRYIID